jgi:hypothetical protein
MHDDMALHAAMMDGTSRQAFGPIDVIIDTGFEAISRPGEIDADVIGPHLVRHGQIVKPKTTEAAADLRPIIIDAAAMTSDAMLAPLAGSLVQLRYTL